MLFLTLDNEMKKLILILTVLAFQGCANHEATIKSLEKDNRSLSKALGRSLAENEQCRESEAEFQQSLVACKDDLESEKDRVRSVCDSFEFAVKNQFVPTVVTVTEDQWRMSPCDTRIQLKVRRLESERVYLKYEVGSDIRYSDPLYYDGKKRDRNALLIEDGVGHPVLLSVDKCEGGVCHVACVQMRTEHLSCYSEEGDSIMVP